MQLGACSDSELADLAAADFSTQQSLAELPLVERWILSALHQARCYFAGTGCSDDTADAQMALPEVL